MMSNNELKDCSYEVCGNIVKEFEHLRTYMMNKDISYIRSNPEEVASEIISAGLSMAHMIGAYNVLEAIREHGMVPQITFDD